MTKKYSTKNALIASAVMLALCISMLAGTTFAWFTDSVTSANNIIQSGNLDIKIEYSADMTVWEEVDADTNVFADGALWEPGYSEVVYLRVSNVGSLAMNYKLGVNVASEVSGKNKDGGFFKLSDYIQYGIVEDVTAAYSDRDSALGAVTSATALKNAYEEEFSLVGMSGSTIDSDVFALVVYMPGNVGNEANHDGTNIPSINLGLSVFAIQSTVESDSFDNGYDSGAAYFEKTTESVSIPSSSTAPLTLTSADDNSEIAVSIPASVLNNCAAAGATKLSLGYSAPVIDAVNNTVTIESFEVLDQNGEVVDLSSNTTPISVSFAVPFADGTDLGVYHDGELICVATVENGSVSYSSLHFCEIKFAEAEELNVTSADDLLKAVPGQVINICNEITLSSEVTIPAGATLNGNGYQINGTIYAGGDLTFGGHVKVTAFSASYYDRVITIPEGACLEITGGGRVSLAYGNVFNITGSITDAKSAENPQPSLIIPAGISITGGNDAEMNVTNAYITLGGTSSKNNSANGTFTLNFNNSIVECTDHFTLAEPAGGKNPTFVMNIEDSVFSVAKKMCIAAPNSTVVVDNSNVTIGTYIRNSGELTLKNGSSLTGSTIQFGENGGNNGTITVDNSTLTVTASSTGHAFDGRDTGKIVLQNNAEATVTYYKGMEIVCDGTSSFTGTEVQ